jgi:hypothetical protein
VEPRKEEEEYNVSGKSISNIPLGFLYKSNSTVPINNNKYNSCYSL